MTLPIVPREAWGAAAPRNPPVHVDWRAGAPLFVHYSAGPPPGGSPEAERAAVRAIQAFHQGPARGWSDIGYAYLVAPSGRVYEGRGHGVRAAHCPGHNDEPSVCLLWKDDDALPPPAALDSVLALATLLGCGTLHPHREAHPTSCPGDAIAAWVGDHFEVEAAPAPGPLTLRQRLARAGMGPRSVDQAIAALGRWQSGRGRPRPIDSELFRRLRAAGLGPDSARKVIYALRQPKEAQP